MNILDGAVVALAIAGAIGGYRSGALTRILSWMGWFVALAVVAWLAPVVSANLGPVAPFGAVMVLSFVIVSAGVIGQIVGNAIGGRLRAGLPPPTRSLDRIGGAVVSVMAVFVLVWALLPAMADTPGTPARLARESTVAELVQSWGPDAPAALRRLDRLVEDTGFPHVLDGLEPAPNTGSPPEDIDVPDDALRAAEASTVRIEGRACGALQDGSGFVVEPGVVATNAHVVAGARGVTVKTSGGVELDGQVVTYDPFRDLALITVEGLDLSPLALRDTTVGSTGGVVGYPGGGPLAVSAFEVSDRIVATGRDLYDERDTTREILVLASELSPGDSGGPLIDNSGAVVGVAFAIAPDRSGTAYALSIDELRAALAAPRTADGNAGRCIT